MVPDDTGWLCSHFHQFFSIDFLHATLSHSAHAWCTPCSFSASQSSKVWLSSFRSHLSIHAYVCADSISLVLFFFQPRGTGANYRSDFCVVIVWKCVLQTTVNVVHIALCGIKLMTFALYLRNSYASSAFGILLTVFVHRQSVFNRFEVCFKIVCTYGNRRYRHLHTPYTNRFCVTLKFNTAL